MENVNVFISGTTLGCSTDKGGHFEIVGVPPGKNDIVASIIGYESVSKIITLKAGEKRKLEFKLKEVAYQLQTIVVSAERPEGWDSNYKIFKERFLGTSPFSSECEIENPEVLDFDWQDTPRILNAHAQQPIKIINNALGYKITFVLFRFRWNPAESSLKYIIKSHYVEMEPSGKKEAEMWNANRREVYFRSKRFFFESLINKTIADSIFMVYREKEINDRGVVPSQLKSPTDSLLSPSYMKDLYNLHFNDYLRVEYTRENMFSPLVSWMKLEYPSVTIDKFGSPQEILPIVTYGFWTTLGVADMLPKYYTPDK